MVKQQKKLAEKGPMVKVLKQTGVARHGATAKSSVSNDGIKEQC